MPYVIPEGEVDLGQSPIQYVAVFQLLNQAKKPVPNVKVHVRMENEPNAKDPGGVTTEVFTNENGDFLVPWTQSFWNPPPKEGLIKYVSLTPIVSTVKEENKAIIWRYPVEFTLQSDLKYKIPVITQPGGGLPEPGAPAPAKPPADGITKPPRRSGTPQRLAAAEADIPTIISVGALSLLVGYIVLTRFFPRS